jgi:uncharacterized protein YcbX
MPIVVSGLAVTPVKGTRLRPVESIVLDRDGARDNRRFFVIDDRDRMVNAKNLGELTTIVSDYSPERRRLVLTFPDGREVEGPVRHGPEVSTRFFSGTARARMVLGPWSEALSEYVSHPLWLVEAVDGGAVDRRGLGAATLISRASLGRLAEVGGQSEVDTRRFRMLIEIDGVAAHAEDDWVGSSVQVGEALIEFGGHVGRCVITSRHPDSGEVDLPTLDILRSYRGELPSTEPLPFGVYGRVLEPGAIRIGDELVPAG